MSIGSIKDDLHRLVDALPEEEAPAVRRFLEWLIAEKGNPVLRSLFLAPEEDEEITPQEETAVQEALESVKAGRVYSHEEALRRLQARR